jgi:hypothetical protein
MEIIARRALTSLDGLAAGEVVIGKPTQQGADEWRCDFEIRSVSATTTDHACGADSVQALMLSFDGIRQALYAFDPGLCWEGMPIDLAFPRTIPISMGDEFYREIESHIDAKIEGFVDDRSKRR